MTAKLAKLVANELAALSNTLSSHFKKTAKLEQRHDTHISACDAKIKKAGASYEKAAKGGKTGGPEAGAKHAAWIGTLRTLGEEISVAKECVVSRV